MWLTRVISSVAFLFSIITSIPLAFDLGGRACGLAFSLSLAVFYNFYSVLKLVTPEKSRIRWFLVRTIALTQWLILPSLLIWSLNRFGVEDAPESVGWVERTFSGKRAQDTSISTWIFGPDGLVESFTIGTWDKLLRWSTPFFQLCEGFCSLLVIQAAGQITRWLVNRPGRQDTWMIALLATSAMIISSSVYFLWRIAKFPQVSNVDAALIGMAITSSAILCAWGIGSGRGNPVESSLLFAYTTLCVYQIFTDYRSSSPIVEAPSVEANQPDFPPLPPIIMASYTTLIALLSTLPGIIHATFSFFVAALSTVTPSIIISLAYRFFVLYASTRIIPAVRDSGARALAEEPTLDDNDGANQILGLLSWFSPSILIAVYTNLLMQHFASTGGEGSDWWTTQGGAGDVALGGNLWRWINIAGTLGLYALELYLGKEDVDGSVVGHWKTD